MTLEDNMANRLLIAGVNDALEEFEYCITTRCMNPKKIKVNGENVTIDCPTCDFSCGFSKKKQRHLTVSSDQLNLKEESKRH